MVVLSCGVLVHKVSKSPINTSETRDLGAFAYGMTTRISYYYYYYYVEKVVSAVMFKVAVVAGGLNRLRRLEKHCNG